MATTTFRRLIRTASAGPYVSLADQGIASISNFIPIIFLARLSTPKELGIYSLLFTICVFATGVEHALITAPYTFYRGESKPNSLPSYSGSVVIHHAVFVITSSVALILVGLIEYRSGAYGMAVIAAAVLTNGTVITREFVRRFFFASRAFRKVLLLDTCAACLQVTSISFLALHHGLRATSVLCAVSASTAPYILCGVLSAPDYHFRLRSAVGVLKRHWSFGKWIVLGTGLSALPRQFFPWCLALFYGSAAAGMLASCTGIVQIANPGLIGFTNYFGPIAARVRHELGDGGLHETLRKATIALVIFLVVFCVVVLILGSHLLALVYGQTFVNTQNVRTLLLLAIALLCYESTLPLGLVFMALDRPHINVLGSLAGLVVTGTIGVVTVRMIGIEGVGVGLVLAGCAESGLKAMFYSRPREHVAYSHGTVHLAAVD
jgi:O-antigen/teichoic acid export membrane protein